VKTTTHIALAGALVLALHSRSALGQELPGVSVTVQSPHLQLDPWLAALSAELAATASTPTPGSLSLDEPEPGVWRLSFRDSAQNLTVRELHLSGEDPETLDKLAIAAANLLQDQASLLVAVKPGEVEAEAKGPGSLQKQGLGAPLEPEQEHPCAIRPRHPIGVDFAPYVGMSSSPEQRRGARHLSLGLFGTYAEAVQGVALSSGLNFDRRGVCGAELGIANLALGSVHGVQAGVINVTTRGVHGAQLGTLNVAFGDVRGLQGGTVNVGLGAVGLQLGQANLALGNVGYGQVGTSNIALGDAPLQLGVSNVVVGDGAAQVGVSNVAVGQMHAQAAVTNVAVQDVNAQVGVANVAANDARVQVGVFNYARSSVASVGLVSIVRHGRTSVDSWASEDGSVLGGVTHGGRVIHNIYGAGARFGKDGTRLVAVLGIGARIFDHPRAKIDLDILSESRQPRITKAATSFVTRARLAVSIPLHRYLSVLVAPGYAVMTSGDDHTQAPIGQYVVYRSTDSETKVRVYPSLSVGLRVTFDHSRPRQEPL
jgi:hypothetical protein